jgi:hypothetical protein
MRLQERTSKGLEYALSSENLWKALFDALSLDSMRNTFICIDAVEELPTDSSIELLTGLSNIIMALNASHPHHRIRVFVSSRYVPEFGKALTSTYSVRISRHHVQNDIEKFIRDSLDQFAESNRGFAAAINSAKRLEIIRKIVERSGGKFLWANIAWENFKRGLFWSEDIVDQKVQRLEELQPGLNEMYTDMISQVDPSTRDDMFAMFSAIATAERPLNINELGILLALQYSDSRISRSSEIHAFLQLEKTIEDNFPDLLSIDDSRRITFVHLSFKEYLSQYWEQSDSVWLYKARRKVARCCLIYLNLNDLGINVKNCQPTRGTVLLVGHLCSR